MTIDYYLKQAADKVTVEILDADDKTITTFTGTAGQPAGAAAGERPPAAAMTKRAAAVEARRQRASASRQG